MNCRLSEFIRANFEPDAPKGVEINRRDSVNTKGFENWTLYFQL